MTKDSPDFQLTITVDTVAPNDSPDWQITAVGPGGASVGGYKSLTGPGETATPGDLTQAGGFTVNDTVGDGIELYSNGPVQVQTNLAGTLAFFNGTPVVQQPLPTTLAEVISYLANYNLWQTTITTPTIGHGGVAAGLTHSPFTVTMSGAPTAGNYLFCFAGQLGLGPVGLPAGFTTIAAPVGQGGCYLTVAYRVAQAGDPSTWTFTPTDSPDELGGALIAGALVWEVSGVTGRIVSAVSPTGAADTPAGTAAVGIPVNALFMNAIWLWAASEGVGTVTYDAYWPDAIPGGDWNGPGYVWDSSGNGQMAVGHGTIPSTAAWAAGVNFIPVDSTHEGAAAVLLGIW